MPRPKIAVVDDPLDGGASSANPQRPRPKADAPSPPGQAPPAARDRASPKEETQPAPRSPGAQRGTRPQPTLDLRNEPLVAVFGRVPASLARRLEGVIFELRAEEKVSQQDVLAALLLRYIDPRDERSMAEVRAALEVYYEARDGRRVRPAYAE